MRPITLLRFLLVPGLALACATASFAEPAHPAPADQVKKLIAILKSDASQKEKADACRELARIGTKEAVAPLAALLPDEKLSHMARYGLEPIPDSSVDKALRDAAGQLHGRLLVGVIGSIGVRHDAKAVKLLTRLLDSPDNAVAQAAAKSLGSIGTREARDALLAALPKVSAANQLAFCEGLLRCAETAAAKGDRKAALVVYDRLRAVPAPQQVLTAALRGSILNRGKDGLPLLARALHSDNFGIVAAAVRTAQEMPQPEVTRLLAAELPNLAPDRQILLIQTLAWRADAAALPALFAAARQGETPVRLAAVRAIPAFSNVSSLPVLVELMDDADKDIATSAQESLASLPGTEVDAVVMQALTEGTDARRIVAMDLVVRRRMTSAIPALFDAAGSSDAKIRTAALKRLGELAGPAELPRLLDLLAKASSPEDLEATEQALNAAGLKATDPASCVTLVEARLASAPPAQKCVLVRMLGAVGNTTALKAVRAEVSDSNVEVRGAAIRALGAWSTADAAPDLLELAKAAANPTEKMICLRGYLRLAGQTDLTADKRLTMCREAAGLAQKDDEKKLLLAALGGITTAQSLNMITPYLDNPGTKEEAATAALDICEKLLQRRNAATVAPRLLKPLEKVGEATSNADRAKRAKELLAQAKKSSAAR